MGRLNLFREPMTDVEILENVAQNHKAPQGYPVEYEGKRYIDVTEYWLETTFRMPELDSKIVELMKRGKTHVHK